MKNLILVMNMQHGYFDPQGTSYLGGQALTVAKRIFVFLSSLDRKCSHVLLTRDLRSVEDSFFAGQRSINYVGTKDVEILPGFQDLADGVVNTCRPSALSGSVLLAEMKKLDIGKVVLVGAETQSSLCFTAADLRFRGYQVTVPEPLAVSRDAYLHNFAITLLTSELGVDVTGN